MKRVFALLFALLLTAGTLTGCGSAPIRNCSASRTEGIPAKAVSAPGPAAASAPAPVALSARVNTTSYAPAPASAPDMFEPFYGIWVFAATTYNAAAKKAESYRKSGFDARVILTTDWSNLNTEPYYCVTLGVYRSKAEANAMLPTAKRYVSSAYVKYSGYWQGCAPEPDFDEYEPFYGIWVFAATTYNAAEKKAASYRKSGFDARVILTTDWSNLNTKPYYCVTLGVYSTKAEADAVLPLAKRYVSNAYIKYSGFWQGW